MSEQSPPRKPFHWKGFVSFVLAGVFLLLIVSGGVLYAAPRGRIANWTEWYVLGLDKDAWSILHMATSCLFVVFGAIHLWLNWTSFASYFKVRFERSFNLKREFALALVLLLLLMAAAVWRLPPVSYVESWNLAIKDHWEGWSARPPYPHAEESTLREFTDRLGLDLNVAVERLDREGLTPETEDVTIADLAASYGVRPDSLYRVIMGEAPISGGYGRGSGGGGRRGGSGTGEGRGMGAGSGTGESRGMGGSSGTGEGRGMGGSSGTGEGRGMGAGSGPGEGRGMGGGSGTGEGRGMGGGSGTGEGRGMGAGSGGAGAGFGRQTIEQLCTQHAVDVDTALAVLKAAGVNATRNDALRDLADESGLRPRDIADMVEAAAP